MNELQGAKLLSATMLVCTGAVCIAIGGLARYPQESGGGVVGLVLLAVGVPMMIRQWTGRGVLSYLAAAARWAAAWLATFLRSRTGGAFPRIAGRD